MCFVVDTNIVCCHFIMPTRRLQDFIECKLPTCNMFSFTTIESVEGSRSLWAERVLCGHIFLLLTINTSWKFVIESEIFGSLFVEE